MSNMLPWRRKGHEGEFGLTGLREEFNRLYDSFLRGDLGLEPFREWGKFSLALDVAEDDDAVVIKADVPGLDAKDIDISVTGQTLTIKGEKASETETSDEGKSYHRSERRYGAFSRTVTLPGNVDAENIQAECKKGVLKITLPKLESEKPRRIEIKTEE